MNKDSENQHEKPCPLLDQKLPPVSDLEHSINSCFCYMCTCGDHMCPGKYSLKTLSHSQHFKTNYKLNFKKPASMDFKIFKRPDQYIQPKFQLGNKSISQTSYVPHAIEKIEKKNYNDHSISTCKFMGNSMYRSDFPSWGGIVAALPAREKIKYRRNELKIANKSQYQEAFLNSVGGDKKHFQELAKKFKDRNWNSKMLLSTSTEYLGYTKMNEDYPQLPLLPKSRGKPIDHTDNIEPWNGQYISTYKEDFKGTTPVRLIRRRELTNGFNKISHY